MKIARIRTSNGTYVARVDGEVAVPLSTEGLDPGADALRSLLAEGTDLTTTPVIADAIQLADCTILAPVRAPQKVLAVGLNYADHARESGMESPIAPIVFLKASNSICGHGDEILWSRALTGQVDYEVELAAVIGRRAKCVSVDEALGHVLGYTICNDVSARDAQFADGQWSRAKSFDTFCPLGPWIITTEQIPDPQSLGIRCRVNGRILQDSTTANMIFSVAEIVSYLSQCMTLEPGDVIATGTPFGVGYARTPPVFLDHGDLVECEIGGIGRLSNTVAVTE